jgi:putative addiction module component (TIGR02574 family)
MTQTALKIYEAYQNLSPEEKDELVEMINMNHEFKVDSDIEKEWVDEAERRIDRFERGEAKTFAADEVFRRIRGKNV